MRALPIAVVFLRPSMAPVIPVCCTFFRWVAGAGALIGRRDRTLSLIYAEDLAAAVVEVLVSDRTNARSYLVEDGCIQTWTSVAHTIAKAMPRTPGLSACRSPRPVASGIVGDLQPDARARPFCSARKKSANSCRIPGPAHPNASAKNSLPAPLFLRSWGSEKPSPGTSKTAGCEKRGRGTEGEKGVMGIVHKVRSCQDAEERG